MRYVIQLSFNKRCVVIGIGRPVEGGAVLGQQLNKAGNGFFQLTVYISVGSDLISGKGYIGGGNRQRSFAAVQRSFAVEIIELSADAKVGGHSVGQRLCLVLLRLGEIPGNAAVDFRGGAASGNRRSRAGAKRNICAHGISDINALDLFGDLREDAIQSGCIASRGILTRIRGDIL